MRLKCFLFICLIVCLLINPILIPKRASAASNATIVVTQASDTINNDGLCSLREAVIAANTDSAFSDCPAGRARIRT
jgi:CSLREA domain-containing protein